MGLLCIQELHNGTLTHHIRTEPAGRPGTKLPPRGRCAVPAAALQRRCMFLNPETVCRAPEAEHIVVLLVRRLHHDRLLLRRWPLRPRRSRCRWGGRRAGAALHPQVAHAAWCSNSSSAYSEASSWLTLEDAGEEAGGAGNASHECYSPGQNAKALHAEDSSSRVSEEEKHRGVTEHSIRRAQPGPLPSRCHL